MATTEAKVLDFQKYREQKQIAMGLKQPEQRREEAISFEAPLIKEDQDFNSRIDRIKKSIQRINALMKELKSPSSETPNSHR